MENRTRIKVEISGQLYKTLGIDFTTVYDTWRQSVIVVNIYRKPI